MPPLTSPTTPHPLRGLPQLSLRSLTLKLTLAFLIVGLLGTLLVAVFVRQGTQRAFNQFVSDRGQAQLMTELARYYQRNGSWSGVASVLEDKDDGQRGGAKGHMPTLALLSSTGVVIVGNDRYPQGAQLSAEKRPRSEPIIVDTTVVGWLLSPLDDNGPRPGSPEANFADRVTSAIIYSAVGATTLALLLSIVLARTLTQPVRELTIATQAVAKGALGQQVRVHSRDELGVLAQSFNQMSTDLAHASTLRRQMTADIAHDLRTPLSVILGYTEALREGKLPAEQDIFDTLHTEAQHLQHLIDDLRTLSLADAGELSLTRHLIAPQALLERTAAAYKGNTEARGISLVVQAAPNVPEIAVDPERIAQVLGNLVSNAVRFTPPHGTITLATDADAETVRLRVSDTGSGIAPDDLPHVFERFYRADAARQQESGSSGLGLAIAKGIVEAHGASIAVASSYGQGTTFTITVPVRDAALTRT